MTAEVYRVRCDGCEATEEAPAGAAMPQGWVAIGLNVFGVPGGMLADAHLCAECQTVPAIALLLKAASPSHGHGTEPAGA